MTRDIKAAMLLLAIVFSFFNVWAQNTSITVSGTIKDKAAKVVLAYANVILKAEKDSAFITGTVSGDDGRFILTGIKPATYLVEISSVGYTTKRQPLFVGTLSQFIEVPDIEMEESTTTLSEVTVAARQDAVSGKMDKKVFSVADNISQSGGSVLQTMQNLPGVTVQDGKVQLRGSDKITVLIDGRQTALTGMGSQSGLDNIPASAIEKIEIINNPSAKYDANGNAGIINIIYKKNKQDGFNGKAGLTAGIGSLWVRKQNLPTIRPQYRFTPKVNPSLSFNYRKGKANFFFQGDYLYTQTLNKNEFVTRTYDNGTVINQQTKRNRNTHFATVKTGIDYNIDEHNMLTLSGMFGTEKIIDNGDQPFFNADLSERLRLWQFLEDELKITAMASVAYQHKFKQPGHLLNLGFNYTFHREDEKYFFDNILPTYTGKDAFALISDEHVVDITADYVRPLKYGRIEGGLKFRYRVIPTNMKFIPGLNSPLDSASGGPATYNEIIPALYSNYTFESKRFEAEVGLRVEYVNINYVVGSNHPVYKTDGYYYIQPFPNVRLAYKINERHKLSLFYNRRVDRPNEVDIRIFPKYDDAEIIKVGNPALRPQFTHLIEVGYKTNWKSGYFYTAAYHRLADGTITRIRTIVPGSTLLYSVMQNTGRSYATGLELVLSQDITKLFTFNLNMNGYHNRINAYTVINQYPVATTFSAPANQVFSGNVKLNTFFHLPLKFELQLTAVYLAPDLIPQGKIGHRFTLNLGLKKTIQKGKGELFMNATDLLNTMVTREDIRGNGFSYVGYDYYETQVIRLGYSYKF
ncbi:MAG TPA: TonB-dependent receptor [Chitinophagales bacterium]|nr:TonB-dependent receptor [Chitinophagales bacterium]